MSTSADSDAGVLRLLEPVDSLRKKIRAAVTDSGREVVRSPEKPGVTNLIEILSVASGETPEAIEARYDAQGYGALKETTYRIGNMGYIPNLSLTQMIDALKEVYEEVAP